MIYRAMSLHRVYAILNLPRWATIDDEGSKKYLTIPWRCEPAVSEATNKSALAEPIVITAGKDHTICEANTQWLEEQIARHGAVQMTRIDLEEGLQQEQQRQQDEESTSSPLQESPCAVQEPSPSWSPLLLRLLTPLCLWEGGETR
jgi:hypothetical protein